MRVFRRNRAGRIVGAAVLLSDDMALTCAHVVEAALGLPRQEEPPADDIQVDFPTATGHTGPARATVAGWFRGPPAGDLALLRLHAPAPPGTAHAPVDAEHAEVGMSVRVFGHPPHLPDGIWARAHTVGTGGPHPRWLQLDGIRGQGAGIEPGFSGAGVWDDRRRKVLGVLASVLLDSAPEPTRVAWMIPLGVLAGTEFAPLIERGGAAAGSGAPDPWNVVDALMATSVAAPDGGRGLLSLLPGHITGSLPRDDRPRLQLYQLVRRCGDFRDGPGELVQAVRQLEGDTITVRRFIEQARLLWPGLPDSHA
ncbi:trypsin-like peptidase domain-containing protein [Streptomyces sp. T-3]|nr:trypsin-like peptidase domain-containing protein [Streptomyces sp. T-3]